MDWIIFFGAITALATSIGAAIGYAKYRYDMRRDRPDIDYKTYAYTELDGLISVTLFVRATTNERLKVTRIQSPDCTMCLARYRKDPNYGGSIPVPHDDFSSFIELNVGVPPSAFAPGPIPLDLFIRKNSSSLSSIRLEIWSKRLHALNKEKVTVVIDTAHMHRQRA